MDFIGLLVGSAVVNTMGPAVGLTFLTSRNWMQSLQYSVDMCWVDSRRSHIGLML